MILLVAPLSDCLTDHVPDHVPEVNIRIIMASKRIAYFYDPDVGNFHYGT